jgi:hypothetical protein
MSKLSLVALLVCASASAGAFASVVESSVKTSIVHSVNPNFDLVSTNGTGLVTSVQSVSSPYIQNGQNVYYGANASAGAATSYGIMKALSSANGVTTEKFTHPLIVTAEASSRVFDTLRITAPGVANGSAGVLNVAFYWESMSVTRLVSGVNADAPSRGHTATSLTVFLGGGFYSSGSSLDYSSGSIYSHNCKSDLATNRDMVCDELVTQTGEQDFFNATNYLEVPFVFGDSLDLRMTLNTSIEGWARSTYDTLTGATILNTFDAVADASHSGYWGGIQAVRFNGADVSYDVQSDSGTDYRQSFIPTASADAPEPSTMIGLMTGIVLMMIALRRTRSTQSGALQGRLSKTAISPDQNIKVRNNVSRIVLIRFLVALGVGSLMPAAIAGEILTYSEAVGFGGSPIGTVATSGHSGVNTYADNSNTTFSSTVQTVRVASTPLPWIIAETASYNGLGQNRAIADGRLTYTVGVHGDAFSWVPLGFQGQYALAGQDLNVDTNDFRGMNGASARLVIGNSDVVFDYRCQSSACYRTITGNLLVLEETFAADAISGFFLGAISVFTNAAGDASLSVSMAVNATSGANSSYLTSAASAYLDPQFRVDEAYLLEHPSTVLLFPEGVGNGLTNQVPEPGSIFLLVAGLFALFARGALLRRPALPARLIHVSSTLRLD